MMKILTMRPFPLVLVAGLIVCLASAPASAQELKCNPCDYSFGNVEIGKSSSYSLQITNTGSKVLTIATKVKQGSSEFSYGNFPVPVKINPYSSIELPIIFTPTVVGAAAGLLTLTSNATNSPLAIEILGTGVAATGPLLGVSPATLSFGKVTMGSSATMQATLTASNAAVTISSDHLSNSEFAIVGLSLPLKIAVGKSVEVSIKFTPNAVGAAAGTAHFVSNAENSPAIEQLAGSGISAKAQAQLEVTPATLSFGKVAVGSSATMQGTLTASNAAVTISSDKSTSSEFAILGLKLPVTVAAGKSVSFTIRFTPNASGTASGKAGFVSNAVNSPTVEQLTGIGVAQGSHSVDLSWESGDGKAVGYNIYRSANKAGPFTEINTALDSSTNYTDSTVVAGATYYYVATEVNAQGEESAYSNVAKAVIP
jgi:hypothetical protein